jgi:hypothetical protein
MTELLYYNRNRIVHIVSFWTEQKITEKTDFLLGSLSPEYTQRVGVPSKLVRLT